jgi:RNA polymerase sigma factor (sigma-70 family)
VEPADHHEPPPLTEEYTRTARTSSPARSADDPRASHAPPDDVARLLAALQQGDRAALGALVPLLYEELRALAHRQRRGWHGDETLDTTALVHEAYLKLVDQRRGSWESRAHFLAAAATAMRHVLINYSRDRRALKRGGGVPVVSLDALDARVRDARLLVERLHGGGAAAAHAAREDDDVDLLLALDAALDRLERVNARQSRIVECRFFGGMTVEETAAALGVSTATVSRGWALAQARLYMDLRAARHG